MPPTLTVKVRVRLRRRWSLKVAGWLLRRFRPVYRTSKGSLWQPLPGHLIVTWQEGWTGVPPSDGPHLFAWNPSKREEPK